MCLHTIDKEAILPVGEVKAWKFITIKGNFWESSVQNGPSKSFNKWIQAKEKTLFIGGFCSYISGFHCYPTRSEARKSKWSGKLVKVLVRGVHTIGVQDGQKTWVAREIFVAKEAKD